MYPCVFGCFQSLGKLQFQHLIFVVVVVYRCCICSMHFSPLKTKKKNLKKPKKIRPTDLTFSGASMDKQTFFFSALISV